VLHIDALVAQLSQIVAAKGVGTQFGHQSCAGSLSSGGHTLIGALAAVARLETVSMERFSWFRQAGRVAARRDTIRLDLGWDRRAHHSPYKVYDGRAKDQHFGGLRLSHVVTRIRCKNALVCCQMERVFRGAYQPEIV